MAAERRGLPAFGFRDECEAAARPPHRPAADELNAENHGRPSINLNNAATPRFPVRQGVSAAVARCFETTNKGLCMPWMKMQKAGHHTEGDPVAPLSFAYHPKIGTDLTAQYSLSATHIPRHRMPLLAVRPQ